MEEGKLCNLTTSLKNNLSTWEASIALPQGRKCDILENLFTQILQDPSFFGVKRESMTQGPRLYPTKPLL